MANVDVMSLENKKAGSIDLDPAVFETPVKPHLFQAEVRRQLALRHRGTHSSKNRAAASGGGAKPYRQKGTGRARQGTTRAPQFAGGGSVFGPVPRDHAVRLPKKVRQAALRSALSARLAEGALIVVEEFELDGFKTRQIAEILGALGVAGESVLIVVGQEDVHVEKSARNIRRVGVVRAAGLNVYDLLRYKHVLVTRSAVERIEARLRSSRSASEGSE